MTPVRSVPPATAGKWRPGLYWCSRRVLPAPLTRPGSQLIRFCASPSCPTRTACLAYSVVDNTPRHRRPSGRYGGDPGAVAIELGRLAKWTPQTTPRGGAARQGAIMLDVDGRARYRMYSFYRAQVLGTFAWQLRSPWA